MSKLDVDGCIPAHTKCPYKKACGDYGKEACQHKGVEHEVQYSCGLARALEMSAEMKR